MYPIVETRLGKVRGLRCDGVYAFKGIPYAGPPFGMNRLRPPQSAAPWRGVRDALSFGPKSPQIAYPPGIAEALGELVGGGEDCLGDGLANLGLLDQIAALEWVQQNIDAFGGDPGQVTIFGQSAGGMSVATLLTVPRAQGLFRRAIVESGNTPHVTSANTAKRIGHRLAALLKVDPTREAIASTTPAQVLQAQAQLREELTADPDPAFWGEVALSSLPWAPTVDRAILPAPPIDAIRAGVAANTALLVGSNTKETRLFLVPSGAIDRITEASVLALVAAYGLSAGGLSGYRAAHPTATAGELFSEIQTDWYWRIPAVRLADAHAANARISTYMYEFAWRSPQLGGRLGAAHGVEIPFIFDTLGPGAEALVGPTPPQSLADAMHRAWVAFAVNGDCGWPTYDPVHRSTMRFDTPSAVVDDPLAVRLALWHGVP